MLFYTLHMGSTHTSKVNHFFPPIFAFFSFPVLLIYYESILIPPLYAL